MYQLWLSTLRGIGTVTGICTIVTDGFPLELFWFQDTSLVAVALLFYVGGII